MADVVVLDDATTQRTHNKVMELQAERERLTSSLRFASRVQRRLTALHAFDSGPAPDALVSGDETQMLGTLPVEDPKAMDAEQQCPICLEKCSAVCVLPECFHILCRGCFHRSAAGGASFRCPLCRVRALTWTVSVFCTAPTRDGSLVLPPSGLSMALASWQALPTKLQRLLTLVHGLLGEAGARSSVHSLPAASPAAADERILIYTQWLAHVDYLAEVLKLASLESLRMSGDLGESLRCLSAFGKEGAPRILLLSSQHHACGINLQAARNLILLHPYCTPSATYPEAVSFASLQAFEQQAIGRIRRYPQRQPVRVFRLFAADTVEEGLYRGGYALAQQARAEPVELEAVAEAH